MFKQHKTPKHAVTHKATHKISHKKTTKPAAQTKQIASITSLVPSSPLKSSPAPSAMSMTPAKSLKSKKAFSSAMNTSIFTPETHPSFFPLQSMQRRKFSAAPVSGNVGDVVGFPLADIGEGITEVEVLQWFIKTGDKIEQFQKICEVQSDKANVEITSRYDGIVDTIEYEVGQMAQVGTPLIKIKLTSATANAPPKSQAPAPTIETASAACPLKAASVEAQSAPAPQSYKPTRVNSRILDPPRSKDEVFASPVVRLKASEHKINLGAIKPSGSRGQITREDLEEYMAEIAEINAALAASDASVVVLAPVAVVGAAASAEKPAKPTIPVPARGVQSAAVDNTVTVTGIQKVMVKTMTAAASIPTLGFADEVCVDNLIKVRSSLVEKAKTHGVKLSNFAFIIKALSLALEKYPQVNAHVNSDCSQITYKGAHNIGLAMDTPKGLLVPNIKNVQSKSILEIGAELNRLQTLGAAGKLGTEDLKGGTITLSNIGTIGGTYCQPILVVPEAAICALGKFYTKAAFDKDGKVYPSTVMNIGWTADHRALDGATVARFSNEFKNFIENPNEMLLY